MPIAAMDPEPSPGRPFLLPSATLTAFVLLIVAVLAFSVIRQPAYYLLFTGGWRDLPTDPLHSCVRQGIASVGGPAAAMDVWASGRRLPGVAECSRDAPKPLHSEAFLYNAGLLVAATGLHYWLRATRQARRRGVRPITADNLPRLDAELLRLADRVIPGRRVHFLIDLLDPAANGVALGRIGQRYVILGRGVLSLLDRDQEAFEALVLHELAHLHNRDVDLTMITLGFFRVYSVLVFAPVALQSLLYVAFGVHQHFYAASFVQMSGLALLLVVARAQVLRSREYQADARVVEWQERTEPLTRLLRSDGKKGSAVGAWALVRRLSDTHPTMTSRVRAVKNPAPLLAPGFGFALVLGACLVLIWDPSTAPAALWSSDAIWKLWWPEPVTALLMVLLGLSVLRAALHQSLPRLHALRWGIPLGLVAGTAVSPMLLLNWLTMPTSLGIEVGNLLLRGALLVLLILWCEYLAAAWAPAVAAARRPLLIAFLPCAAIVAVALTTARPVFEMHSEFILTRYNGTALSDLPGPLLVFAVAETIALDACFEHIPWFLGMAALLFGAPMAGRLWRPRRPAVVFSGKALPVRLPSCGAAFLVGGLTYAALWWALRGYLDVVWEAALSPLSDGMLLAGVPAVVGAVAAISSLHPLRRAALASALIGMALGTLFAVALDTPVTSSRPYLVFGVQGAFLAALTVAAMTRSAEATASPSAETDVAVTL
ncbi:M48 family metallopeptidase [Streptomyces lavendulae]|uniref:M48 family metallopeptidase n=1 Tax=Streptomyces lavendulae TaxID=1914 RepID=UPI003411889C